MNVLWNVFDILSDMSQLILVIYTSKYVGLVLLLNKVTSQLSG